MILCTSKLVLLLYLSFNHTLLRLVLRKNGGHFNLLLISLWQDYFMRWRSNRFFFLMLSCIFDWWSIEQLRSFLCLLMLLTKILRLDWLMGIRSTVALLETCRDIRMSIIINLRSLRILLYHFILLWYWWVLMSHFYFLMWKSGIIEQSSHGKVLLEIILGNVPSGECLIKDIRLCWRSLRPLNLILRCINVLIFLKIFSVWVLVHGSL